MKKKLLIVLVFFPLTKYYFKKFYFKKNKKWKIKYWNLLGLYNEKIYKKFSNNNIIKNKQFININSLSDLQSEFRKLPKFFHYISYVPRSIQFSLIDRMLKIYGGRKSLIRFSGLINSITINDQVGFILKNLSFKLLVKILFSFFRKINFFIANDIISAKPKTIFAPNQLWLNNFKRKYPTSKLIETFDYEYQIFRYFKKKIYKKKYIVFVDQMADLPFDEQVLHNKKHYLDKNKYWTNLNIFLNFCEKKFRLKSIIAAHPRRDKKDLPNIDKRFIFNKTPQLIKDSALVVLHQSTAISLAVLFKKPMVLLTLDEFEKMLGRVVEIKKISKELNLNLINLDKFNNKKNKKLDKNKLKIDNKKYQTYLDNHIKFKNNKSSNIWGIVFKELEGSN